LVNIPYADSLALAHIYAAMLSQICQLAGLPFNKSFFLPSFLADLGSIGSSSFGTSWFARGGQYVLQNIPVINVGQLVADGVVSYYRTSKLGHWFLDLIYRAMQEHGPTVAEEAVRRQFQAQSALRFDPNN
jgi:hypothetical protein